MAQPQKKEIVINAREALTRVAILEDGDLAELFLENQEHERTIGNIVLGRIRRIMPSIRAAFVDIGQKQDAFLHFSDLSDHLPQQLEFVEMQHPKVEQVAKKGDGSKKGQRRRPQHGKGKKGGGNGNKQGSGKNAKSRSQRRKAQRRSKKGRRSRRNRNMERHLKQGQRILVKITKEPISNKGSRISTDISMAGRFLVLVPFGDYVAVSKKITSYKERKRLRTLAKSLLPDGFGVIIRTVAEGRNAKALDTDLRLLLEKWRKIESKLQNKPKPPKQVHEDVNMVSSVMRDLFSSDYDRVLIDDQRLFRNIRSYIQAIAPQMAEAVKLHEGKQPVFEAAGITKDVAAAFESRVELPSGGYLFIEHTEAMHVIDVNSGRSGRGMSQEESSLKCNLEAARVITRQLRLRDLGGIIVIDFIDLRDAKNRKKVYDELKSEFKKDRAVTKVLPMSDFGVVQITRQRLRPSITTTFSGPDGGLPDEAAQEEAVRETQKQQRRSRGSRGRSSNGRSREKEAQPEPTPEAPREEAPPVKQEAPEKPQKPEKKRSSRRRGRSGKGSNGRGHEKQAPPQPVPAAQEVAAEEMVQAMEQWITDYRAQGNRHAVTLQVHPFTAAYLNRKVPNYPTRWFIRHLVRVRLESTDEVPPTTFRFVDTRSGEDLTEQVASAGTATS